MTETRVSGIIPVNMPIKDVTDLRIYQQSMRVLPAVYELMHEVPEWELRDQIQRAARSIAPMIAEGFAKKHSLKEFKRYLFMALGSCDEVQTHLQQVSLIYHLDTADLEKQYKDLAKQIRATINGWS